MHELSIAQNLLMLAEEAARTQNCSKLRKITIHCGQISGIMPEALQMAFQELIAPTAHKDAILDIVILPLRLRCPFCADVFEGKDQYAVYGACPQCGEEFGHIVEQGKELILARVEAEK